MDSLEVWALKDDLVVIDFHLWRKSIDRIGNVVSVWAEKSFISWKNLFQIYQQHLFQFSPFVNSNG